MKLLDRVLDYAERLPEGIERARDQIIGTSDALTIPSFSNHIYAM